MSLCPEATPESPALWWRALQGPGHSLDLYATRIGTKADKYLCHMPIHPGAESAYYVSSCDGHLQMATGT